MVVLEQASLSQITVEYLTHTLVEIGRSDLKRTFEMSVSCSEEVMKKCGAFPALSSLASTVGDFVK